MKLIEAVSKLARLDEELSIYMRVPWTASSLTRLALKGSREAEELKAAGLVHFLKIGTAKDILEEWRMDQDVHPTEEQCCSRLIDYAKKGE